MTHVSLKNLTKIYPGSSIPSVKNLSLEIESGSLTTLLGPSGCGKTTTMRMIAGLLSITSGDISFNGRSIIDEKPERREAVMVFQNHLLFPYMSVAENIGFGLKMRKVQKVEINKRVFEMLELLKLPKLGERRPRELSGGQQQRVALARALIIKPKVLLLDEPLSNLDSHLRFEMRDLISNIQKEMSITTIFVTHDQEEAVVLADKVALILNGQLKQYEKPDVFYNRPIDKATARFFGGQNFISGISENGVFKGSIGNIKVSSKCIQGKGILTFRPESIKIKNISKRENILKAQIVDKIFLGAQTSLKLLVKGQIIQAISNPNESEGMEKGNIITIGLSQSCLWVLKV